SIPQSSFVTLKVYDIIGNEIATLVNEEKAAGRYDINFDASNQSSGVYLYSITAGNYNEVKKMTLIK
ncbi:MAG: T9SS type A sorting domain-containing protein, partial [Ignavibacteriaceae bacterium]